MTVRSRFRALAFSLVIFIIFGFLSIFVHRDFFRSPDYRIMVGVQKISGPVVDYVFSLFTLMGSSETTLLVTLLIFSSVLIKRRSYVFAVFLYILIYPLEILGKLLIYHPMPPVTLSRYVFDFHLPSSFVVVTNYSFPSGHMARSAYLVTLLALLAAGRNGRVSSKGIKLAILAAYFLLMFISRIYLGEHWLTDVVGGTLLGAAVGLLSFALW